VDRELSVSESRTLADPAATEALGVELAGRIRPTAIVHLVGDLGAGKSTLARSMLRSWGEKGAIRSPTYTLIESYDTDIGAVHHLDLYRLGDAEELYFLGVEDMLDQPAVWLIEWPDVGENILPPPDWHISLAYQEDRRDATWRYRYRVK